MKKETITVKEHLDHYSVTRRTELQLLEAIMGKRAMPRIHKLLQVFDYDTEGFNYEPGAIFRAISLNKQDLVLRGLTEIEAERLYSAVELGLRLSEANHTVTQIKVSTPEETAKFISPRIKELDHEVFGLLCLGNSNNIIANRIISIGTNSSTVVSPREVFSTALSFKASAIIVYHNHPGKNPHPSNQDLQLTNQLLSASRSLLLPILDHIVVAGEQFYSFAEHGQITN